MARPRPRWPLIAVLPPLLLALAAPPATALPVEDGEVEVYADFNFDDSDCDRTLEDPTTSRTKSFDSSTGARSVTVDNKATVVTTGDPADTTTLRARAVSRASVTAAGGSLDTATLSGEVESRHNSAFGLDSACDTRVQANADLGFTFKAKTKGRLVLTWSLKGRGELALVVARADGGAWVWAQDVPGVTGRAVVRVPAGMHEVDAHLQTVISLAEAGSGPLVRTSSYGLKAVFKPAS